MRVLILFFIFFLMFFIIGALMIISNNNLAMSREGNFSEFSGLYVKWLDSIYANIRMMTGYVVNLNWLPK